VPEQVHRLGELVDHRRDVVDLPLDRVGGCVPAAAAPPLVDAHDRETVGQRRTKVTQ
jgi:hypothetical protein